MNYINFQVFFKCTCTERLKADVCIFLVCIPLYAVAGPLGGWMWKLLILASLASELAPGLSSSSPPPISWVLGFQVAAMPAWIPGFHKGPSMYNKYFIHQTISLPDQNWKYLMKGLQNCADRWNILYMLPSRKYF